MIAVSCLDRNEAFYFINMWREGGERFRPVIRELQLSCYKIIVINIQQKKDNYHKKIMHLKVIALRGKGGRG